MKISEREIEEQYNDALDDCGMIKIGILEYAPSDVLKSVDPIAYRCGLADYISFLIDDEIIFEHADGTYHSIPEGEKNESHDSE